MTKPMSASQVFGKMGLASANAGFRWRVIGAGAVLLSKAKMASIIYLLQGGQWVYLLPLPGFSIQK